MRAAYWGAAIGAGAGYASVGTARGAAGGAVVGVLAGFAMEAVVAVAGGVLLALAGASAQPAQLAPGEPT